MGFTKGAVLGMIAGTIVGVMNRNSILNTFNMNQKKFRRFRKRYMF